MQTLPRENNKRVFKVIRFIARLNIGGPAIHTILLTKGLDPERFQTTLVCGEPTADEGDMSYYADSHGVEFRVIEGFNRTLNPASDIRAFFAILGIIRTERPDIIHTHTAKAGTIGRLAAIVAGVPVKIHTFHGHVFKGYFGPLQTKAFLLIERFLGLFTDRIVTVSESLAREISEKFRIVSGEKMNVIPLGFNLKKFLDIRDKTGALYEEFGIARQALSVGIVGRLVPIKNHRCFLDAARILLSRAPNRAEMVFFVIGDGALRPALERYARAIGIAEQVIFTGWRTDIEACYRDLDIVVCSSDNEGTPVSVIEAMASSRAVVATDVGGIRDVITDGVSGIIVPPGNPASLAEALTGLLTDGAARSRLGACARVAVSGRYSSERLINDVETLYHELLIQKGVQQ
ncbi:MAG: glycosyltransferase family 4 protein [Candidatus Omnitrophica bacterium]|nr:glycosyltransferase family 4 protein [Candidatus Omnitrophota bacterium]